MTTGAVRDAGEPVGRGGGSSAPANRSPLAWPRMAGIRVLLGRHPLLVDAAFALGLVVLLGARADAAGGVLTRVFALLMCLPLVLRRRYPLPVFGFMCGVAAMQWVGGFVLIADAALLVGLYTVAAQCERRLALLAAAVLEAGVAVAVVRWAPQQGALTAFVFLSGMATAAFVLGVNIQTRRAYMASLEDRALRAEHERDQQLQLAAAGERARIAREMHDIVAHNLSVMIALADGAAFAAGSGSPQAESAARQVSATGRAALGEMHRLLGVLRDAAPGPSRAPQPGIDQLDDLVAQVRSAGLATSLTVVGQPFALPTTAQLAVYRVAQEALTNVLKHADSPTEARVRLSYQEPIITLEITDDGQPTAALPASGHGLAGMRERAAMFDGEVRAGTRPGGAGWRVSMRLDTGRDPREAPTPQPAATFPRPPDSPSPADNTAARPGPGDHIPEPSPGEDVPGQPNPGEEIPGEPSPGKDIPGLPSPDSPAPGEDVPAPLNPGEEVPAEPSPGEEVPGQPNSGAEVPGLPSSDGQVPGEEVSAVGR